MTFSSAEIDWILWLEKNTSIYSNCVSTRVTESESRAQHSTIEWPNNRRVYRWCTPRIINVHTIVLFAINRKKSMYERSLSHPSIKAYLALCCDIPIFFSTTKSFWHNSKRALCCPYEWVCASLMMSRSCVVVRFPQTSREIFMLVREREGKFLMRKFSTSWVGSGIFSRKMRKKKRKI